MKSRIKFSLGPYNGEIIEGVVTTKGSDDIRDRIAKGFIQGLNYESNLCFIEFGSQRENDETPFTIFPVCGKSENSERNAKDTKWLVRNLSHEQKVELSKEMDKYFASKSDLKDNS